MLADENTNWEEATEQNAPVVTLIESLVANDAFIRKLASTMITLQQDEGKKGGIIKSSNYNGTLNYKNEIIKYGNTGWAIDFNGIADFSNGNFSGTLDCGQLQVYKNSLEYIFYTASKSSFNITGVSYRDSRVIYSTDCLGNFPENRGNFEGYYKYGELYSSFGFEYYDALKNGHPKTNNMYYVVNGKKYKYCIAHEGSVSGGVSLMPFYMFLLLMFFNDENDKIIIKAFYREFEVAYVIPEREIRDSNTIKQFFADENIPYNYYTELTDDIKICYTTDETLTFSLKDLPTAKPQNSNIVWLDGETLKLS